MLSGSAGPASTSGVTGIAGGAGIGQAKHQVSACGGGGSRTPGGAAGALIIDCAAEIQDGAGRQAGIFRNDCTGGLVRTDVYAGDAAGRIEQVIDGEAAIANETLIVGEIAIAGVDGAAIIGHGGRSGGAFYLPDEDGEEITSGGSDADGVRNGFREVACCTDKGRGLSCDSLRNPEEND